MSGMAYTQRQIAILEWLEAQGSLTIGQLAERFEVSAMTIHRDLDKLAGQGYLRKVRGGALPAIEAGSQTRHGETCAACGKRVPSRTQWVVTTTDGRRWHACCSHCGLLQLQNNPRPQSALSADFLYGRMISVFQAVYVVGSNVMLCCVPSILCFATPDDAHRFQNGFGGEVLDFAAAMLAINNTHHIAAVTKNQNHLKSEKMIHSNDMPSGR